jgi:hypothetical protein
MAKTCLLCTAHDATKRRIRSSHVSQMKTEHPIDLDQGATALPLPSLYARITASARSGSEQSLE